MFGRTDCILKIIFYKPELGPDASPEIDPARNLWTPTVGWYIIRRLLAGHLQEMHMVLDARTLQSLDAGMQQFYKDELAILSEEAKRVGLSVISPVNLGRNLMIEFTLGSENISPFTVQGSHRPMPETELRWHFRNQIRMRLDS
jgi:hypothetical protein